MCDVPDGDIVAGVPAKSIKDRRNYKQIISDGRTNDKGVLFRIRIRRKSSYTIP